jgi:hypothetical protein
LSKYGRFTTASIGNQTLHAEVRTGLRALTKG